jgi:uncharacterized membrane protein
MSRKAQRSTKPKPADPFAPRYAHLHPLARGLRLHARLLASFVIGVIVGLLLPSTWAAPTRMLAAWDMAVLVYLVTTLGTCVRSDVTRIRRRAAEDDEGAPALLVLVGAATLASLGAILLELAAVKTAAEPKFHLTLAAATILLSWLFAHVIFALHYADQHYDVGNGLNFPGEEAPDYWDFLYFSLVIGMTCQVSDVAIANRTMRRTATAHGVFSFIFNTAILALTVNIAASLI